MVKIKKYYTKSEIISIKINTYEKTKTIFSCNCNNYKQ